MEHKKKKNERLAHERKRFIVIVSILMLVLLFGFGLLVYMVIAPRDDIEFDQTATPIVATNQHVWTLLRQTDAAATE